MPYHHATDRQDYSDFASGSVFHSLPGEPALPVRLVSEIFQRCQAVRAADGRRGRAVIYDPCCGSAYHLGSLGFLHGDAIQRIIASDVNEDVLGVAWRNLDLLSVDGMDRRIAEISSMLAQFGKDSHAAALGAAQRFRSQLLAQDHPIDVSLFAADATDSRSLRGGLPQGEIDIVLADVPYGWHTAWQISDPHSTTPPLTQMLDGLRSLVTPSTVVAIVADKGQSIRHERYRRAERFQIGKRQIAILNPL